MTKIERSENYGNRKTPQIRVPLDVLDMIDDIRLKTGLTRSKVMTEMITFAYERTEIIKHDNEQ